MVYLIAGGVRPWIKRSTNNGMDWLDWVVKKDIQSEMENKESCEGLVRVYSKR